MRSSHLWDGAKPSPLALALALLLGGGLHGWPPYRSRSRRTIGRGHPWRDGGQRRNQSFANDAERDPRARDSIAAE